MVVMAMVVMMTLNGLHLLLQCCKSLLGSRQITRLKRLTDRAEVSGELVLPTPRLSVLGLIASRGIGQQLLQGCEGLLRSSQIAGLQATSQVLKILADLAGIVLPVSLIGLVRVSN